MYKRTSEKLEEDINFGRGVLEETSRTGNIEIGKSRGVLGILCPTSLRRRTNTYKSLQKKKKEERTLSIWKDVHSHKIEVIESK